jgi:hypothetical protein
VSKKKKGRVRRPNIPTASDVGAGVSPSRETGFQPDYSHVRRDLRRIAILAGAFIGLMVVASLFFR